MTPIGQPCTCEPMTWLYFVFVQSVFVFVGRPSPWAMAPLLLSTATGRLLLPWATAPRLPSTDTARRLLPRWGCTSCIQPTHNSKAPGYNPWKLYEVMSWFLKPLLSHSTCTATPRGADTRATTARRDTRAAPSRRRRPPPPRLTRINNTNVSKETFTSPVNSFYHKYY
jgi:hypothetical protein